MILVDGVRFEGSFSMLVDGNRGMRAVTIGNLNRDQVTNSEKYRQTIDENTENET
jgi:hypothetical protein